MRINHYHYTVPSEQEVNQLKKIQEDLNLIKETQKQIMLNLNNPAALKTLAEKLDTSTNLLKEAVDKNT